MVILQNSDFSLLYDDTEYKLSETGSNFGIFGNPDLEPETTVSYELGLAGSGNKY